jgi:glyoxylase-like metal-dependent hydrolase (beta-lactamase superfamily II)
VTRILTSAIVVAALCTAASAQQAANEIQVLPVRGNVFMLVAGGSNVTVSAGIDGMVLVDAGPASTADKVIQKLKEISATVTGAPSRMTTCVGPNCYPPGTSGPFTPFGWVSPAYNGIIASPAPPKPLRWILETTLDADHSGGVPKISAYGRTLTGGEAGRLTGDNLPATVIGHENLLKYMTLGKFPELAWPTETYYIPSYKMSQYVNGEGIQMYHLPGAITDGDSMVHFRFSDVISAGDVFTPGRYPAIDLAHGGSVNGLIDALNKVIEIAFPEFRHQGGTMVIGGHGRLGDSADVAIYRNMIEVIRDRIQAMIKDGKSLQQIKAAKPTLDYDGIYGSPDTFIDAIYQSLVKK